ncbi:MAG: YwaF family protein [Bacilli bacterium]|jgi:hypothetical integral membrane protein (TIGR02206 family)|nr:YwaF family protein [Bacilli bacterium]
MFDYFFTYISHIPKGIGFEKFSIIHFLVLILGLFLIYLISNYYIKLSIDRRNKFKKVLAIIIFSLEWIRQLFLIISNQYEYALLPLHLCSITVWIILLDAFKASDFSKQYLYFLGITGAIAALLFPDWSDYPIFNIFCWHSFIIHFLFVLYIVNQLCSSEIIPSFNKIWQVVLFLIIVVPIIYYINIKLNTNFFFINQATTGSPLAFLANIFGSYYLLGFILLIALIWFIIYLPWLIKANKS